MRLQLHLCRGTRRSAWRDARGPEQEATAACSTPQRFVYVTNVCSNVGPSSGTRIKKSELTINLWRNSCSRGCSTQAEGSRGCSTPAKAVSAVACARTEGCRRGASDGGAAGAGGAGGCGTEGGPSPRKKNSGLPLLAAEQRKEAQVYTSSGERFKSCQEFFRFR